MACLDAELSPYCVTRSNCYDPVCLLQDAPDCACFVKIGEWNPAGTWIQDVAHQTVGTQESCGVANGGKPYWQMVLGLWMWGQPSHSLMIDEMWVRKEELGQVFKIDATLLEGDVENPSVVQYRGWATPTQGWSNILSYTLKGTRYSGNSWKIQGFGVDLNGSGHPIYDPTRLHYVNHSIAWPEPPLEAEPRWEIEPEWGRSLDQLNEALLLYDQLMVMYGPILLPH